jgi:GNAT superfamily N-acetyltransferase
VIDVVPYRDEHASQVVASILSIQRDEFDLAITADRLLDALLEWARSHGVHEIFLGTPPRFPAAHRFYERRGFVAVERSALPPGFPIMIVDEKFYRCAL